MADKPKVTIIKTTRPVCVRSNAETGEVTDANGKDEVYRVPTSVAMTLIGDQSAVESNEDELAAYEKAKAKAAAKPAEK